MVVNIDNQGSTTIAKNPVFQNYSKHIGIQYRFTCDLTKEQRIHLEYIPTKDTIVDLFIKSLFCT